MQRKRATLILIVCLIAPQPRAHADDMGDMFGVMFRMMLTMMNVMSGSMLGNNTLGNNNWLGNFGNGLGGFNSFNLGMSAFPALAAFGSPWSSFGGTPWNAMGGSPWSNAMSPWSGPGASPWSMWSNPWSSAAGNPWSSGWGNPWSSGWNNPFSSGWGNPWGGGYPGYPPGGGGPGWGSGYGAPINYGGYAPGAGNYAGSSLLNGRWYGSSGEVLEIRGNRFQLQQGKVGLNGVVEVNNNIVSMFSPQTNSVTRYTFVRNQYGLLLQDAAGTVLTFTNNPVNGVLYTF